MQDYRRLEVWERAHCIALTVYGVTNTFPTEERFGLTSQLRRCAVSIGSNIAEGSARGTDAGFAHFLHIAAGSAAELDYQLLLARDLAHISATQYAELADQIGTLRRKLTSLIATVKANSQ